MIIALIFLTVSAYSAPQRFPPAQPNSAEKKANLIAAGISEGAAEGIIAITEKHTAAFQSMQSDVDNYMKTQSEADQEAYKAYVAKIIIGLFSAAAKVH